MDIVTRIKIFLNSQGFAVSQFADRCEIPRPTVSQLLNGRNKKVSDEIISKIHIAYPELSIMWLMFGEEPMLIGVNDAKTINTPNSSIPSFDFFDENEENPDNDTDEFKNANLKGLNNSDFTDTNNVISGRSTSKREDEQKNEELEINIRKMMKAPEQGKTEIKSKKSDKEIVNIMVFYSDNSFESFKPAAR